MTIRSERIDVVRTELLKIDTGTEKRLFYPAAGDDVGCSVGLFWQKCDAFYLIDTQFGLGIQYDHVMAKLAGGIDRYMAGLQIESDGKYEEGAWEGSCRGRRYQVWQKGQPKIRKRLCFASTGTMAWLSATPSVRYNVVLNKDYAGIDATVDDDYPETEVWGRLCLNGIYGATIGGKSTDASDFGSFRYNGFNPLYRVTSTQGEQIGFAGGLHLFQKTVTANKANYDQSARELKQISDFLNGLFEPFLGEFDFSPKALDKKVGYEGLLKLMLNTTDTNWRTFYKSQGFKEWVTLKVKTRFPGVSWNLVLEFLMGMTIDQWGSW
jgi:hypothetical protein